jgi:hypothetical protein
MGIIKVDGRMFLDSGTVIVSGEAAVEIEIQRAGYNHVVAVKFRRAPEPQPDVMVGNPLPDRTVIHLINFARNETSTADYVPVGKIGKSRLRFSYVIKNSILAGDRDVWWLTYTFYAEEPSNG